MVMVVTNNLSNTTPKAKVGAVTTVKIKLTVVATTRPTTMARAMNIVELHRKARDTERQLAGEALI